MVSMSFVVVALCLPSLAMASDGTGCTDTAPQAVKVVTGWMTEPDAPASGREVGIEVEATITADGRATELGFSSDAAPTAGGRQSVRNAVDLWRFTPATRCGEAVAERVILVVPMKQYAAAPEQPFFARNATDAPQRLPRDLP